MARSTEPLPPLPPPAPPLPRAAQAFFFAIFAILLAAPPHVLCLHWLWTGRPRAPATLLLTLLLAAAGLACGFWLEPTMYLATAGMALAVLQYFASKHKRYVGLKSV